MDKKSVHFLFIQGLQHRVLEKKNKNVSSQGMQWIYTNNYSSIIETMKSLCFLLSTGASVTYQYYQSTKPHRESRTLGFM